MSAKYKPFSRKYDPAAIEAKAESTIAECMARTKVTAMPLPIPVEAWIEGPLKIDFGIEDLSHIGPDVLGGAYPDERRIVVSEKLLRNEGRFRYTCAHELGHLVLHAAAGVSFRDNTGDPGRSKLIEREADHFAAAFLMPARLVAEVMTRFAKQHGFDPRVLSEVLREGSPESDELVRLLSTLIQTRFTVSYAAALFRVREVVLPDPGPLTAHLNPALLFRDG
jgi:hypothetical protein